MSVENVTRLPAADRYLQDPHFAVLVDTLTAQISQGNYTPSELREAVILACTRWEMMRPPNQIIVGVDWASGPDRSVPYLEYCRKCLHLKEYCTCGGGGCGGGR